MKKLDKRQIEYMAQTIIPELYKIQADADASLEDYIQSYFAEDESEKDIALQGK